MIPERVESWWRGLEWCILNAKKYGVVISLKKWSVGVIDEFFRPKPWYFERDCLVCTRSASSIRRYPLYFFAHAMSVKWWYHAKFQPFQSSFCSAFQFHGHLAKTYEWMPEKEQMKWERVENCWCGFELFILITQRVWSSNKFKIMKSLCNRWVCVRTLILRKRLSVLYMKCIQFLP